MQRVYFISGLGADRRVFSFLDLSWCEPIYLDWIEPLPDEDLRAYALRLTSSISEPDPVIVGLSLGGMMATEIAKERPLSRAVLISSNKTGREFPTYLKMFRFFPIYKVIPGGFMKGFQKSYTKVFGVKGSAPRDLMYQVIADADINFVKWGIHAIINWKNEVVPMNVVQVHGTADKLLPYRLVKADYTVENGGHVMTMDNAEEVGRILRGIVEGVG